jgi:hypothetical protein
MSKPLTHLREMTGLTEAAGPGFFSEAKQYNDSGEFTDEFYDIFAQVNKMKKVMKHPKWMEFMKATDRNSDASLTGPAKDAISAVTDLENALIDIDREFDRVNNTDSNETTQVDDSIDDGVK